MAKPELGTKRICPETGRKFYDLNKDPIVSPYTGEVLELHLHLGEIEVPGELQPTERGLILAALATGESGIRNRADVVRLEAVGARAFLVGESLLRQADVSIAVKELLGKNIHNKYLGV